MDKSQIRLPFLDIMINEKGTKNLNGQQTNRLKCPIYSRHCLTNISFFLERRMYAIAENEN